MMGGTQWFKSGCRSRGGFLIVANEGVFDRDEIDKVAQDSVERSLGL